ncbi:MAG TPA: prenyltransferase/squalene oxidase repeat-containing protein [Phycisphaerae bacterium]|nr:prenyltransferase/squalene oxidase repeat-containing protein [Phycisphaerae bacterium]
MGHNVRPTPMLGGACDRLATVYDRLRARLLAARGPDGVWTGELAGSALATATATCALLFLDRRRYGELASGGVGWLLEHQNGDGGWGDTVNSFSNVSTTMLARAALTIAASNACSLGAAGMPPGGEDALRRAEGYLARACGGSDPHTLAEAIRGRYGKDRTFSVPILTCCALAGLVDWREVTALPFELACAPPGLYRWLRLPVVSYALPALIALGIARFKRCKPRNPVTRAVRRLAMPRALRRLESIQPTSGGFLEATPLTSFVVMSLADAGFARHRVVERAADFLVRSARPDGSWPIDTNLATWVTTLSVNALAAHGPLDTRCDEVRIDWEAVRRWLVGQQYRVVHPYTSAAPGGWAWTPLPGGVPDADDTAGALLALRHLPMSEESQRAAAMGLRWLLDLQNGDGGWPTFCRGWGHLPFDRSGADLTAHALRALHAWTHTSHAKPLPQMVVLSQRARRATQKGLGFLERTQRDDGSWPALWFGNQRAPGEENPTYGTARVLRAYCDLEQLDSDAARRAIRWLLHCQHADGGWGGAPGVPPSIEETALAAEALVRVMESGSRATVRGVTEAVTRGINWLIEHAEEAAECRASPIGFYFAKLWYFERLYPLIFTVGALGRALGALKDSALSRARGDEPGGE